MSDAPRWDTPSWKDRTADRVDVELSREIDIFETQIELRRRGRFDEKLFAETRLRRGAYGQRYDNGQRHDGTRTQTLAFPSGDLTKGPHTIWDAPGMQRIKLPMGRMTADQMDVLAELAEEYADDILHVTTRQDIQLHFVHIEDTPPLMRRLGAVGITTREACGNAVRNITACPFAGVCGGEPFDVTPYAHALTYYLMGHRDTQDFGRKFKIAFSGCRGDACGLLFFHDIGCLAVTREVDGHTERGFELYVGGGLGSVPRRAKLFDAFVPASELLPVSQAICRVFARFGEKQKRTQARLKFLVDKMGLEVFKQQVDDDRSRIASDERWTSWLDDARHHAETPLREGRRLGESAATAAGLAFASWRASNTRSQKQPGYVSATVRLPLGDATSDQFRALADLARRFTGDHVRCTVEQNLVFRWLSESDLPTFHAALVQIGVGDDGASTIADITACPGTDTCKLGISSSRGLAAVLEHRLREKGESLHPDVAKLRIKASGCFNSCGQHHVADIGFLGVSRNLGGRRVAHFQLVVGGQWLDNGGAFGLPIGAYPSKNVPAVVDRLIDLWISTREPGERLQAFIPRVGRAKVKAALDDLRPTPAYAVDPSYYVDWGDAREYTTGDLGIGECAGEIVALAEFGLADSEREVFEAQIQLDRGDAPAAAQLAYRSMLSAAKALIQVRDIDIVDQPDTIVREFRTRFHETKLFWDPFVGAKFARYLLEAHAKPPNDVSTDEAHRHIEQAQLFIEAAHSCHDRIQSEEASR